MVVTVKHRVHLDRVSSDRHSACRLAVVDVPRRRRANRRRPRADVVSVLDASYTVPQRGAEVRPQEEIDNKVGWRADDDEHVGDVSEVGHGMRTSSPAENPMGHLQQSYTGRETVITPLYSTFHSEVEPKIYDLTAR